MVSNPTLTHTPEERMLPFLTKFATVVRGVVSGFDRLFFGGSLRNLAHVSGLKQYLWKRGILYVDFAAHSQKLTAHLEETGSSVFRCKPRRKRPETGGRGPAGWRWSRPRCPRLGPGPRAGASTTCRPI